MPNDGLHSNTSLTPVVQTRDGVVFTDSRDVARFFDKEHHNVLRDIDVLLGYDSGPQNLSDLGNQSLRGDIVERVAFNEAANRETRYFELTERGFAVLVGRFTGQKPLAFQLAYYDQFAAMRRALKQRPRSIAEQREARLAQREARLAERDALLERKRQDFIHSRLLDLTQSSGGQEIRNALIVAMAKKSGLSIVLPAPAADAPTPRSSRSASKIGAEFGVPAAFVRATGKALIAAGTLVEGVDWHSDAYAFDGKAGHTAGVNADCKKYYDTGVSKMRQVIEGEAQRRANKTAAKKRISVGNVINIH